MWLFILIDQHFCKIVCLLCPFHLRQIIWPVSEELGGRRIHVKDWEEGGGSNNEERGRKREGREGWGGVGRRCVYVSVVLAYHWIAFV